MKKKQFMSKLAALTIAATMTLSTGVPVFAATVKAPTGASEKQTAMAAALQKAAKDVTFADDAAASSASLVLGASDGQIGDLNAAAKTVVSDATATLGTLTYNTEKNEFTGQVSIVSALDSAYDGSYDGSYDITVVADVKADDAYNAAAAALKKADLSYNTSLTEGKNEENAKSALEEALSNLDTGLIIGDVDYNDGTHGNAPYYTVAVTGKFNAGDYKDVAATTVVTQNNSNQSNGSNWTFTLPATSEDGSVLDDAATALKTYKTADADTTTTQDDIAEDIQSILDADEKYNDVTFTINNFKKTDGDNAKITGDVVLSLNGKTETVKLNKKVNESALAADALKLITAANVKEAAEFNFTTDDKGVATGLDKDQLAEAIEKEVTNKLNDSAAVVDVTITTYGADKSSGNGYAVGSLTVSKNGETSAAKIFTINAALKDGSYEYSAVALGVATDGAVRDANVLKKSDNQKVASVVDTLDKAVKKDATLGIKNKSNKNVPLTKNDVLTQAKAKVTDTLGETVTLKHAAKASDDKKVDTANAAADAIVVKSYTAPTTDAAGTAVITINYNVAKDGDTTYTAADAAHYVNASHDITLTFPKLNARTTTSIRANNDKTETISLNASEKPDAKDYFTFNGNSALTWTSSDESVVTVDAEGNVTPVGIGKATITVAVAGNSNVKATKNVEVKGTTAFKDVQNPQAYYYDAVNNFATKKNTKGTAIVSGISKDEFGIDKPITRAQFVTFLYRIAGEPAVFTTSKFTDVASDAYYAKAVAWAVKQGITYGESDTTFNPNATVNRAQAVTFLYRFEGSPKYNSNAVKAFADVPANAYYYDAVQWAAGNVTYGKSATTFAPSDNCTRAQGITMIDRAKLTIR